MNKPVSEVDSVRITVVIYESDVAGAKGYQGRCAGCTFKTRWLNTEPEAIAAAKRHTKHTKHKNTLKEQP